jgi:hypothetical protein
MSTSWLLVSVLAVGPAPAPEFVAPDDPEPRSGPPPSESASSPESASDDAASPASASDDAASPASASDDAASSASASDAPSPAESEPEIRQPEPPVDEGPPDARAIGGLGHTPLPPAPTRRDPTSLDTRPWRGRGWFDLRVDAMIPLAGRRPARGNVVSVAGGFNLGWRIHEVVGVYAGMNTFVHDEDVTTTVHTDGSVRAVQGVGRTVLFDLAVMRLWLPVGRRVQPWADVGGGVGVYRAAFSTSGRAVGTGRAGVGVDFWLSPTFTLTLGSAYRLQAIDRTLGHALSVGAEIGVHW